MNFSEGLFLPLVLMVVILIFIGMIDRAFNSWEDAELVSSKTSIGAVYSLSSRHEIYKIAWRCRNCGGPNQKLDICEYCRVGIRI